MQMQMNAISEWLLLGTCNFFFKVDIFFQFVASHIEPSLLKKINYFRANLLAETGPYEILFSNVT